MTTTRTPRVVLVEETIKFDLTELQQYGDLHFIYREKEMNPGNTDLIPKSVADRLDRMQFDPDVDYVCLTGSTLRSAMFFAVVCLIYGDVRILMFDPGQRKYKNRLFKVSNIDDAA